MGKRAGPVSVSIAAHWKKITKYHIERREGTRSPNFCPGRTPEPPCWNSALPGLNTGSAVPCASLEEGCCASGEWLCSVQTRFRWCRAGEKLFWKGDGTPKPQNLKDCLFLSKCVRFRNASGRSGRCEVVYWRKPRGLCCWISAWKSFTNIKLSFQWHHHMKARSYVLSSPWPYFGTFKIASLLENLSFNKVLSCQKMLRATKHPGS